MSILSYEEARKKVWSFNFTSIDMWIEHCSNNCVDGVPSDPESYYGEKYDESDWIGFAGNFWSYNRAKEFVKTLNISSMSEWWSCRKAGKCPATIPSNPNTVYTDWVDWPTFLGYSKVSYVSYEEAKAIVADKSLATMAEYKKWWRENDGQLLGLPLTPNSVYKTTGWEGSKSFLNYESRRSNTREYLSYEDAKAFMAKQNLGSHAEWIAWCRYGDRPNFIPSAPDVKYRDQWCGFPEFLGYSYDYPDGRRHQIRVEVMSYDDAKEFIQAKKFMSQKEFAAWAKTPDRPIDFPSSPNRKYKNKGWEGFAKFLGYYEEKTCDDDDSLVVAQVGGVFSSPVHQIQHSKKQLFIVERVTSRAA